MGVTDKSFSPGEKKLLKSLIGRRLEAINACIVARGDMAWNTVRLHFDESSIDVNNTLGKIVVDELGTVDEFGLMRISDAEPNILDMPGVSSDTSVIPVEKTIRSIRVANDVIVVHGDGVPVAEVRYPQAVIFDMDEESLVLDKETWFDETISIKTGPNAMKLLCDDTVNWADDPEEDPSTHYEARMEIETL